MQPRRASLGDPFDVSSQTQGEFVDAVEELRTQQFIRRAGNQWSDRPLLGTIIKALNVTGQRIPRYGVVEIGSSEDNYGLPISTVHNVEFPTSSIVNNEYRNQVYFRAELPTADYGKTIGIAQEPINEDVPGDVMIDGVTQARLWWRSDLVDSNPFPVYAKPYQERVDYLYASYEGQAEVIWSDTLPPTKSSGYIWALVRLGHRRDIPIYVKAQADWEENGTYPIGNPRVSVKLCDPDGQNPRGYPFWVSLPRNQPTSSVVSRLHDADPAIYEDWVIKCRPNNSGSQSTFNAEFYCISEYLHQGKIKDIKMQGADDIVPTGWQECDGDNRTGNAGAFTLINFDRDQQAVGGSADKYGAMPIHKSSSFAVGEDKDLYVFDDLGDSTKIQLPNVGSFDTTPAGTGPHTHDIPAGRGEYPQAVVYFIQRWK